MLCVLAGGAPRPRSTKKSHSSPKNQRPRSSHAQNANAPPRVARWARVAKSQAGSRRRRGAAGEASGPAASLELVATRTARSVVAPAGAWPPVALGKLPAMAQVGAPPGRRVGWWAGAEPADPLAALTGWLLRREVQARVAGVVPVLVHGGPVSWADPGFTGELALLKLDWPAPAGPPLDVLVASGTPEPGGPKLAQALTEAGTPAVAVAPAGEWGFQEAQSVGPPFAVPEPALLAARHLPGNLLEARRAFLRVVEGLPRRYVLVDPCLLSSGQPAPDFSLALAALAQRAGGADRPAPLVRLSPGPLALEDPEVEGFLRRRRAEAEEARAQPEDWQGYLGGELFPLRVTSPVDLAAAVAGAGAVVAGSAALMALAWALGAPHVAVGPEGGPASNFAAWTGDASALAAGPAEV